MKNAVKNKCRIILSLFLVLILCTVLAPLSLSAQDDFELQIAAFPESYKPYLRELHAAHPNWVFEPFFTTLDFNLSVDSEGGPKSLVSSSAAANILKSKDIGDYNYAENYYIQKDGGFVEANRLAVAYYMDPRNFLNEESIFLFETLSFNDSFTVDAIENVLKGSFMADKKITWYNSKGEKKEIDKKYSEAIFDAGKTYDVNPCFLASKILNEVGYNGSKSVTGTHSEYPGIYNFYNIGAYDGANAIARGLEWASSGTTYSRPWNTPVKSINGGAEYLAASYIACGQFTGYLQRFNVNPDNTSYYVYDHQYMTNLSGALTQAYSTYASYVNSGLLENTYVFSIPIYENMPSWTTTEGEAELIDGVDQTAAISASACFVRTGPSTNYAKVTDVSGVDIKLTKGQSLTVLDKVFTDTDYCYSVLQYPYWYKVAFNYNGTVYEGYVAENFINTSTVIRVGVGYYTPGFITSSPEIDMHLISYNANVAAIEEGNVIRFKKAGTVNIAAYDSLGRFDRVKYVVTKEPSVIPTNLSLTDVKPSSAVLNFTPSASASRYEVIAVDGSGNITHRSVATSSPYIVTGLTSGSNYKVYIRAVLDDSGVNKVYGPVSCLTLNTLPDNTVVNKVTKDADGNITVHWNALAGIEGYDVCTVDTATNTYTKIDSLTPDKVSYVLPSDHTEGTYYAICAYSTVDGVAVYGKYSQTIDVSNIPADITETNVTNVTKGGYTVTWSPINGAQYNLYKENNGSYELFKTFNVAKFKLKKAGYSAYARYKVAAFRKVGDIIYEGPQTAEFSATSKPAAVQNLKISTTAIGGKLTWNKVNNATKYQVFIYKENKQKYVRLATVNNNKYTLKGRKPGKNLKVQVRACIETTYGEYYGNPDTVTFWTRPVKVSQLEHNDVTTSSFKITWNKSAGANKYVLYQYNGKKKKYVKVTETTSRSFTRTGLKAGTTYRFKVKALKVSNGKVVSSNMSSVLYAVTNPTTVKTVTLTERKKTYLTLSWKGVTGGDMYQIYRYNSKKDKYVKIATVEGDTEYTVTDLTPGKTYYFKIRAINILDGESYYGEYSDSFGFKTKS